MGKTTITVREDTLERFNRLKDGVGPDDANTSANLFLCILMDVWEEDIEPWGEANDPQMPPGFIAVSEATEAELAEIRERVEKIPELTAEELEERFR